jgi:serine/threonine protein kinase
VELEYRRDADEQPERADYRDRFANLAGVLDELLGSAAGGESPERTALHAPAGEGSEGPPVVPGYEVLGVLGGGGMGLVYRARHVRLGREVALKLVRAGRLSPMLLTRLLAEARAVAQLDHPHIVKVYEVGEYQPTGGGLAEPYIALELVAGGSLEQRLQGRRLWPAEAARLVSGRGSSGRHTDRFPPHY